MPKPSRQVFPWAADRPHSIESKAAEPTADVLAGAGGNLRSEPDHLAEGMP